MFTKSKMIDSIWENFVKKDIKAEVNPTPTPAEPYEMHLLAILLKHAASEKVRK